MRALLSPGLAAPCAAHPHCWDASPAASCPALRQRGHRAAPRRFGCCSFGAGIWRKQGCALHVGAEPPLLRAALGVLKVAEM